MAEETLTVKIKLKDMASQGVKRFASLTKKHFAGTIATLKKVRATVFSLRGAFMALAAGYGIYRLAGPMIQAFVTQEKAIAGMEQAMRSMGRYSPEISKRFQEIASELQKVGIAGDEAVLGGAKFLVTFTKITDKLMPRALKAMADYAAFTGGTMAQAAMALGKAAIGQFGELTRVGIEFRKATLKSKDFTMALEDMERQIGGQNEAMRKTGYGGLVALGNAWGDVKEQIGEALVDTLTPYAKVATTELGKLTLETSGLSDTLKDVARGGLLMGAAIADGVKVAMIAVTWLGKETRSAWATAKDELAAFYEMQTGIDPGFGATKRDLGDIALMEAEIAGLREGSYVSLAQQWLAQININAAKGKEVDLAKQQADAAAATANKVEKLVGILAVMRGTTDDLDDSWKDLTGEFEKAPPALKELNDALAATPPVIDKANQRAQRLADTYEGIKNTMQKIGNVMGDTVVGAVDSMLQGTFKLKDALQGILRDIALAITRMVVMKAIEAGTSGIMGLFKGGGGEMGPGFQAMPARERFGAGLARGGVVHGGINLPRAAKGMVVRGPTPLIAGDNKTGVEGVVPLKKMGSGNLGVETSGSGGVTHIHLGFLDVAGAEAWLMGKKEAIKSVAQQIVLEEGPQGLGLATG